MLIVVCQKRANVVSWVERHPLPFPVLIDDDRSRTRAWGAYQRLSYDAVNIARPASFVVGPAGAVRYARVSRHQADPAPMEEILGAVR